MMGLSKEIGTRWLAIVANTDGGQYCPQAVPNNRWSYYDGTEMIGDDITIECHGASKKKAPASGTSGTDVLTVEGDIEVM